MKNKIIFQHENGKYLSAFTHEDGGNASLVDDMDDATTFDDFSLEDLGEMLESSDDYEEGNDEWDYTKFKKVPVEFHLKKK